MDPQSPELTQTQPPPDLLLVLQASHHSLALALQPCLQLRMSFITLEPLRKLPLVVQTRPLVR